MTCFAQKLTIIHVLGSGYGMDAVGNERALWFEMMNKPNTMVEATVNLRSTMDWIYYSRHSPTFVLLPTFISVTVFYAN